MVTCNAYHAPNELRTTFLSSLWTLRTRLAFKKRVSRVERSITRLATTGDH